jgi:hypothetical protein
MIPKSGHRLSDKIMLKQTAASPHPIKQQLQPRMDEPWDKTSA